MGSASQIIYPSNQTANPSSQPSPPDYDAIIQQQFVEMEERQTAFQN